MLKLITINCNRLLKNKMENLLKSVRQNLDTDNWYSALILSLTLPDICGGLENKPQGNKRYSDWFEKYLNNKYAGFLSGDDCYALRCSFLHEGTNNIEKQRVRRVLDQFIFLPRGSHLISISKSILGDPKYDNKSILQMSVERFCLDIVAAVEVWMKDNQNNQTVQNNLKNMLEINLSGARIGGIFIK